MSLWETLRLARLQLPPPALSRASKGALVPARRDRDAESGGTTGWTELDVPTLDLTLLMHQHCPVRFSTESAVLE